MTKIDDVTVGQAIAGELASQPESSFTKARKKNGREAKNTGI